MFYPGSWWSNVRGPKSGVALLCMELCHRDKLLDGVTIGGDTYGPSVLWSREYVAHLCVDAVNKLFGKRLTEERFVCLDFDYFLSIVVFDRFYLLAVVAGIGRVLI